MALTAKSYKCSNCSEIFIAPTHCGRPMDLTNGYWVCWKGEHLPCCGRDSVEQFNECCQETDLQIALSINDENVLM